MAAEAFGRFVRDGHRRLGLALSDHPLNYETIIVEVFRSEARRLGLGTSAVRLLPLEAGRLTEAGHTMFASGARAPTAVLATHECIAASLYEELDALGLRIGRDVSLVCTFPALDTRSLVPALSHFDADLDAVGIALADRLIALTPEASAVARRVASTLVPLTFAARASHGRAPAPRQGVTQAPLREDERTQASTKATPATPSSTVG